MLRKILVILTTTAVVTLSFMLPGCGGDGKIRDLPEGKMPEPTAEEKAQLKADPTSK
jgi:hypothetical protein